MIRLKLRVLVAIGLAAALSIAATIRSASAEDWPTRPVRLVLTLGPGSGADIGARLLADKLSQRWGQPVIVDNRPGGDGIVAINAFVSAHDDHILLFSPTSSFTAHPFLHDHLPYKLSDLEPITRVSNTFVAVSVPTSLNVDSVAKFVALAKEKPGQLNWAGLTGALDFLLAGWLQEQNLNVAKIAYKNPVEAANDLAEGRRAILRIRFRHRATAAAERQN